MKAYEVIAARVKQRGISKAELSRRSGIDDELIRRSLIGMRHIKADEFVWFCNELELDLSDFEICLPEPESSDAERE